MIVFALLLGLAAGSFAGAFIYRWQNSLSLRGRSVCTSCGAQIRSRDNIPLYSWIALRGRSSCCKEPISSRYLAAEISGALLGAALYLIAGIWSLPLLLGLCLAGAIACEIKFWLANARHSEES